MKSLRRSLPCTRIARPVEIPVWLTDHAKTLQDFGAESVALFGSRATGRYLDDSDWDIVAVVQDREKIEVDANNEPPLVHTLWLNRADFINDFHRVGTISFEIQANCHWLHGAIQVNDKINEEDPSRERMIGLIRSLYRAMFRAISDLRGDWRAKGEPGSEFETDVATETATAAAFAAKLVCLCNNLDFQHTHNVETLAKQVPSSWHDDVLALNGNTPSFHVQPYEPLSYEPFLTSVRRLQTTLQVLNRLLDSIAGLNLSAQEKSELGVWLSKNFDDVNHQSETDPSLQLFRSNFLEHIRQRLKVDLIDPV